MNPKKLLIIDGHNFLFRGYYGVPEAATLPNGFKINAIYGFFSLLRNTVKNINPENLLIVFDSETGIKNKLDQYPEYKSNRTYPETNIFEQLIIIRKIIDYIGISSLISPDYEADDLIGTYAKNNSKSGNHSYIASNDFDFVQMVSDNIYIVRGIHNNIDIFDENTVISRFGVSPTQYLSYHALKGDTSDNLSGIRGIGIKTAKKLICEFNNIENLYQNLDNIPYRIKTLLEGKENQLLRLKSFITINSTINPLPEPTKMDLKFNDDLLFSKIRNLINIVNL